VLGVGANFKFCVANNFLVATVAPTGLDMVLQAFTQKAAQILDPSRTVNPLCNWVFMVAAAVAATLTCWLVIDRVVEPRLARVPVDGDPVDLPAVEQLSSGRVTGHKDVIRAMSQTMSSMGYFMVLVFFAAQFIRAFAESNLGALVALEGGLALKALALPSLVTMGGMIGLTAVINVLVASASAKWAMLSSIFVPMLMTAGISPEATQLAYRIGDSPSNILTPLNYQFPLVLAFSARYVRGVGIGTIISLCLPIAGACFLVFVLLLAAFWVLGVPLGLQAPYLYP
jgi:p-aminobenzoyl-glutamate transporter AbgT